MFKYIIICLVILFLVGCSSESSKPEAEQKTESVKPKAPKKKSPKKVKEKAINFNITDENVVKKLTSYGEKHKETIILMKTSKGNMKIKLYNNVPLHRANFIMLAKNGFYENTVFYRVVKDFMVQGGDSDADDRATKKKQFGRYTIPPEFRKDNIHKKGVLSMSREYKDNPEKRSVSFDFFLVQGEVYSNFQLDAVEMEHNRKYTEEQRKIYTTIGGTPHLDFEHTAIGEVIEGIEVIDSIAAVNVDNSNWPISDVKINIEIIN